MIRIQEHLDINDVEEHLDNLAEEHWKWLNPVLATGKAFKKKALIEKCKRFSAATSTADYIKDFAGGLKRTATRHKKFFNLLLESDAFLLKEIVVSRPTEFSRLKKKLLSTVRETDLFVGTAGNYRQTAFGKLCSEQLFDYGAFRGSQVCLLLYKKMKFKLTTCPYCNDHHVMIVPITDKMTFEERQKAYLDLDHFYPKSLNPFFAVSFFNLIPVCRQCNSDDKAAKPFTIETHIHPYHEAFDDFYTYQVSMKNRLGVPSQTILINKKGGKASDRTLDDLFLEERIQGHLGELNRLVDYYNKYSYKLGTADAQMFIDSIFEAKGVPKLRKHILTLQRGKLFRDVLMGLDIHNVLGFS